MVDEFVEIYLAMLCHELVRSLLDASLCPIVTLELLLFTVLSGGHVPNG